MEPLTGTLETDDKRDEIAPPASKLKETDVTTTLGDLSNGRNNGGPLQVSELTTSAPETVVASSAPDCAADPPQLLAVVVPPPPLSKKALKRKRRWDEKLAVKKRRKEHARETKRAKAILDGRDVEQERRDIEERTKEGEGRKRREKVRIEIVFDF